MVVISGRDCKKCGHVIPFASQRLVFYLQKLSVSATTSLFSSFPPNRYQISMWDSTNAFNALRPGASRTKVFRPSGDLMF